MDEPRVVCYPSDGKACGHYRLMWPGEAVKKTGKPVTVRKRSPEIMVDHNSKKIYGINVGDADVVVLQRPGSRQIQEVIPVLHEQGKKIIVDMDDSLSLIHPRNPFFKDYDPRVNHQRNWMHAAKACEMVDLVTVTTEALAEEYGKHGRVAIIPNHVPESYLKIERPVNDVPVVIWAGWTATHVSDLAVTHGMINQALIDTGAKFAAFGDTGIFTQLGIRNRPPHECWGFTNIVEYPKKLVLADIGLVPLQQSPFNNCKSGLKILEYSSLGIVPISSPTPDNLRLFEMGLGFTASTPKEWYNVVKELILDNEMRQELSDKVRKIAFGLTIEGNTDLWWNAWSSVV